MCHHLKSILPVGMVCEGDMTISTIYVISYEPHSLSVAGILSPENIFRRFPVIPFWGSTYEFFFRAFVIIKYFWSQNVSGCFFRYRSNIWLNLSMYAIDGQHAGYYADAAESHTEALVILLHVLW